MFRKVLIANRGEIAVRVIRTCRMMGVRTVAIYSDADRDSLHVKLADQSFRVGHSFPKESYLNARRIIGIARKAGAEAIHPGYGFLSENPDFAGACESAGIRFIGPKSRTLKKTGNKVECRRTLKKAGFPVLAASDKIIDDIDSAEQVAEEIGYPLLLKSAFGGGGRGIREARDRRELRENFRSARSEAERSFGKPGLYVEKLIRPARHIEFQVISDGRGKTIHLGERECSIQRRHQKLLELTPSPALDEVSRKRIGELAVRVAKSLDYENVGTVEFLRDEEGKFYFIEVNARLQVEHPITESVTGLDLVQQQLLIASGEGMPLSQKRVVRSGASMQCRINAEDAASGFAPSTGTIHGLRLPSGPGVRVDTAVYHGYRIPEFYDSLIAKVITWGQNLEESRLRMMAALEEFTIDGVRTTTEFQKQVISHNHFREWKLDIDFVEKNWIVESLAEKLAQERQRAVLESAAIAASIIVQGIHKSVSLESGPSMRSATWAASGGPRFYDAV